MAHFAEEAREGKFHHGGKAKAKKRKRTDGDHAQRMYGGKAA